MKTVKRKLLSTVRFFTRRTPILYGYFDRVIRSVSLLLPSGDAWITVPHRNGTQIRLNLANDDGRQVFLFGANDLRLMRLLEFLLHENDSFVDVGANCGSLSLAAAGIVGRGGYVLAFEPNHILASALQASISVSNVSDWTRVENVALGDCEGAQVLCHPVGFSGHARLSSGAPRAVQEGSTTQVVQVRTLDSFLKPGIPHGGVMKLDVEGYENAVFRGGERWVRDIQPRVIIFECKSPGPLRNVPAVRFLDSLGYEFFVFSRNLFQVGLVRVDTASEAATRNEDIVAVLRSHLTCITAILRKH